MILVRAVLGRGAGYLNPNFRKSRIYMGLWVFFRLRKDSQEVR
jgi:hypothetical protein